MNEFYGNVIAQVLRTTVELSIGLIQRAWFWGDHAELLDLTILNPFLTPPGEIIAPPQN